MKKIPHKEGFVCLGVIATPHGVRGEIRVKSLTANPLDLGAYGTLVDMNDKPFKLERLRNTPKGVLAFISGITDRNDVEHLRGTYLYVPRANLPEPEGDDVYLEDFAGLTVLRLNGDKLGEITEVFETGANLVLTIKLAAGGDLLIPYTSDIIEEVDLKAKNLTVSDEVEAFLAL